MDDRNSILRMLSWGEPVGLGILAAGAGILLAGLGVFLDVFI